MPSFETIGCFFDDFADSASWTPDGGNAPQVGVVIVDSPDTLVMGDMVITTETTMIYPQGQWPGLDEGQFINVNGDSGVQRFRVRTHPQGFDDGRFLRIEVVKA